MKEKIKKIRKLLEQIYKKKEKEKQDYKTDLEDYGDVYLQGENLANIQDLQNEIKKILNELMDKLVELGNEAQRRYDEVSQDVVDEYLLGAEQEKIDQIDAQLEELAAIERLVESTDQIATVEMLENLKAQIDTLPKRKEIKTNDIDESQVTKVMDLIRHINDLQKENERLKSARENGGESGTRGRITETSEEAEIRTEIAKLGIKIDEYDKAIIEIAKERIEAKLELEGTEQELEQEPEEEPEQEPEQEPEEEPEQELEQKPEQEPEEELEQELEEEPEQEPEQELEQKPEQEQEQEPEEEPEQEPEQESEERKMTRISKFDKLKNTIKKHFRQIAATILVTAIAIGSIVGFGNKNKTEDEDIRHDIERDLDDGKSNNKKNSENEKSDTEQQKKEKKKDKFRKDLNVDVTTIDIGDAVVIIPKVLHSNKAYYTSQGEQPYANLEKYEGKILYVTNSKNGMCNISLSKDISDESQYIGWVSEEVVKLSTKKGNEDYTLSQNIKINSEIKEQNQSEEKTQ